MATTTARASKTISPRMLVKIERLSKELSKERRSGAAKNPVRAASEKDTRYSVKEERELGSLLYELKSQVQQLSGQNTGLRGKVQYFKTLHQAETRKRTPYGHIPPRIESVHYFVI